MNKIPELNLTHRGIEEIDRKSVAEIARGYIDRFGMADRIEPRPGDCINDDLGSGYDFGMLPDTRSWARGTWCPVQWK
jgi:hypothetical protein